MKEKPIIKTHHVESHTKKIEVHVFEPPTPYDEDECGITGTIVTVHPWATLGGGEHNTIGLAKCITTQCSNQKWRVITFTLESNPLWRGGTVWGILSKHHYEVQQIVDVAKWAMEKYNSIVLLGSSAGAPMAGTAMSQLLDEFKTQGSAQPFVRHNIIAYIGVGYTFGNFASLGFGRHFTSITSPCNIQLPCKSNSTVHSSGKKWTPPKLFIMGENDEFTTVTQLKEMVQKMKRNCTCNRVDSVVVPNVGHFQLESPSYDPIVSKISISWLNSIMEDVTNE